MEPRIAFCSRCRDLRLDWNKRRIPHWLLCQRWLGGSSKLTGLVILALALILGFPEPSAYVISAQRSERPGQEVQPPVRPVANPVVNEVRSMNAFLKRHKVSEAHRSRLAESIVTSARKYNLNPRLLASIMIVESRGNPYAISGQDAVGIMQIHLPTWGQTADLEDINLFKIEDNVDFGARILGDYVRRFGVSEGVKRYNGYIPGDPIWEESAGRYLAKVQLIYES